MLMPFELLSPTSLDEAVRLLADLGDGCKVLAGGTDVLVAMHGGYLRPAYLLDLKGIRELRAEPFFDSGGLWIPALATHDEVERMPEVGRYYAALLDGVSSVGSVQTRVRGTIGGNICNAAPSGDSLGPLLALDATLTLFGPEGERTVAFGDFFPGAKRTILKTGELLTAIQLPPPTPRTGSAYTKFGRRKAMDLALLGVTVRLGLAEDGTCELVRIALTTAAATVIRGGEAEAYLTGKKPTPEALAEAGRLASAEATPRSSWRAPAAYRHALIETLVPRTAEKALERLREGEGI